MNTLLVRWAIRASEALPTRQSNRFSIIRSAGEIRPRYRRGHRDDARRGQVRLVSAEPILPAVSGGLNPETVAANVRKLGGDVLLLAGTGVFGHPDGPEAGVNAL